jgi:RNA polymerase sigma-70 factor, ECF subfamily
VRPMKPAPAPSWDPAPSLDQLVPLLFDELHAIAHRQLAREHGNFTLQTTDLVHEAYLRLAGDAHVTEHGRAYFSAATARAMRQVLVDSARRRNAAKRGSGAAAVSLDENTGRVDAYGEELLELDLALRELEQRNPRHARTVECRFFGGMTVEDTANALGVSPRTVKTDWALARAWLFDALRSEPA